MTHITKHTPGPWRVDGEGMQVYKDKQPIAVIRTVFDENGGRVTREANAALIAAAPAMYEALRVLTSEINLSTLNVRKDFSLLNAHACAVKAILQAEGKLL